MKIPTAVLTHSTKLIDHSLEKLSDVIEMAARDKFAILIFIVDHVELMHIGYAERYVGDQAKWFIQMTYPDGTKCGKTWLKNSSIRAELRRRLIGYFAANGLDDNVSFKVKYAVSRCGNQAPMGTFGAHKTYHYPCL